MHAREQLREAHARTAVGSKRNSVKASLNRLKMNDAIRLFEKKRESQECDLGAIDRTLLSMTDKQLKEPTNPMSRLMTSTMVSKNE